MLPFPPLVLSPGTRLYKAMKTGRIYVDDFCDFADDKTYGKQKWLSAEEKDSASGSVIMFGDLHFKLDPRLDDFREADVDANNSDIALKISPYPSNPNRDNSVFAEQKVYATLVSNALLLGYTPHLLAFVGSFSCSYKEALKFAPKLKALEAEFPDPNKGQLTVTILEKGNGTSLGKLTKHLSDDAWKSILFQTLWTVEVIGAMGGRHNDLHLGNVFIDQRNPKMMVNYFVTKKKYFRIPIPAGLLVKIFDWDFGYAPSVNNTKIKNDGEMCKNYGTCATVNPKYDEFIFLWNLIYHKSFPKVLKDKLESCCIDKTLVKDFDRGNPVLNGRLCYRNASGGCKGEWSPPDSRLLPPLEILTKFFAEELHDVDDINTDLNNDVLSWDEWFEFTYEHPNMKKNSKKRGASPKSPEKEKRRKLGFPKIRSH